MSFYVMECEGEYPSASIESGPDLKGSPWYSGKLKSNIPTPLIFVLDRDRRGILSAMYDSL
jgi:hypothetical protein